MGSTEGERGRHNFIVCPPNGTRALGKEDLASVSPLFKVTSTVWPPRAPCLLVGHPDGSPKVPCGRSPRSFQCVQPSLACSLVTPMAARSSEMETSLTCMDRRWLRLKPRMDASPPRHRLYSSLSDPEQRWLRQAEGAGWLSLDGKAAVNGGPRHGSFQSLSLT